MLDAPLTLLLGFAVLLMVFLIVLAAEGLHWATGGKTPELIDWQPRKPHPRGGGPGFGRR